MTRLLRLLRRPDVARGAGALFSAVVFALALWVLHRAIGRFDVRAVVSAAASYPAATLVGALGMAAASYAVLTGFDGLAVRHIGRPMPPGWTALISFVSHAVSHNAGFAVLTGGSVRLRMYSTFGLGVGEVASVIAFAGLTFALGTIVLAGGAFILEGDKVARLLHLPAGAVIGVGWAATLVLAAYLAWTALAGRPLAVGGWRFATPSLGVSLLQITIAAADLALVAGALYLLLPLGKGVSYPAFVGLYVVATLAGIVSHVPGGLGVFEGALVLMLPQLQSDAVLAALLVFRVFYNLLPLLLAAVVLGVFELQLRRRRFAEAPPWLENLGPALAAVLVFGAGVVELLSGAVARAPSLAPVVAEPGHLLSGAAGAVLLVSAWGMVKQSRAAWRASMTALVAGAWLSLLRGPDWIAGGVLAVAAAVLVAASPLFARPEPEDPLSLGWFGAAAAVVVVAFWLTAHLGQVWLLDPGRLLHFAPADAAARALRANLVAAITLAAAWAALRTPTAAAGRPTSGRRP
ncbi:MAG: lysylphosphatidylglycerol synthase domain-containing protein [Actinomycetota bacterium]